MKATGGTEMWCSKCKKLTICKAVSPREIYPTLPSSRRFYKTAHEDVHFFRRGRICLVCNHKFLSAESSEMFLHELVELRDALAVIKQDTEQYLKDAETTAASLSSLNDSLSKLRALKVYQKQDVPPKKPFSMPKVDIKKLIKRQGDPLDDF
jgi:hypothetical protein